MKPLKRTFLLCLFTLLSGTVFSHALWIETKSNGKAGQTHQVKVYFGEFEKNNLEPVSEWYADLETFKLWLIGPDGKKEEVKVTAANDHFIGSFTPAKDGVYKLQVNHLVGEVAGTTVYEFNSSAVVAVGKPMPAQPVKTGIKTLTLHVAGDKKPQVNKAVEVRTYFTEQAAKDVHITVFSPKGWQKQMESGEHGQATFIPEWSGNYLLEAQKKEDAAGEINSKAYTSIFRISTLHMPVI